MSDLAPEGAPVEPVVEETPAEQPWTPDPAEWQATQERLDQIQQVVQPQPQWQPPQGPVIPDPWNRPETYEEDFKAYIEYAQAPYAQFQQQLQNAEAEERGMAYLDEQAKAVGEFDRDTAWARANILTYQGVEVYKALEQAAKETREYERRVGEAYHQQQIEQIQTVAGAPRTIAAGINGAQTVGVGNYGNVPGAVTARMFGPGR
jgi:hypothetical protein